MYLEPLQDWNVAYCNSVRPTVSSEWFFLTFARKPRYSENRSYDSTDRR